jgi:Mg/Co/Ni transporter MgtE
VEKPITANPDEHLEAVAERMNSANVAHVPVVDKKTGGLVGYLCWKDIVSVQASELKNEPRKAFFRREPVP